MEVTEINGQKLTEEQLGTPAFPCGLIAKSYFNGKRKNIA